jgi:hypothetical protein
MAAEDVISNSKARELGLKPSKSRVQILTMNREIAEATQRYAQEMASDQALGVDNMTEEAKSQAYVDAYTKARGEYGKVTETDELIANFFDKVVTDKSLRVVDMVKLATTLVPMGINAFAESPQATILQELGIDPTNPADLEEIEFLEESLAEATKVAPESNDFISNVVDKLGNLLNLPENEEELHEGALASISRIAEDKEFRNNLRGSDGTVKRADSNVQQMVYRNFDTNDAPETSGGRVPGGAAYVLSYAEMQSTQTGPVVEFGTMPGLEQIDIAELATDVESITSDSGDIKLTDEFVAKHLYFAVVEAAQEAELEEKITGTPSGIIKDLGGAENVNKLLTILANDIQGNLITVAENGVITYEADLMTDLQNITTEDGVNEFDYLVGFIENDLVPTVEGQLLVDWQEVEAPYVEQKDPSVIDGANITSEDFRASIASFLAIMKDPEHPLFNAYYTENLTGSEAELLQKIAGDPEFTERLFEEHDLQGKSIKDIHDQSVSIFSNGTDENSTTSFINAAFNRTMPLFGEGTRGETIEVSHNNGYSFTGELGDWSRNVTLDIGDWNGDNLIERVSDVADMILFMSKLDQNDLEELQAETQNLVNIEDRVLALTRTEFTIIENLETSGESITTTEQLEEYLVEKGFNVDRASHVAALFNTSTAEVIYNFLENHDVIPTEVAAAADNTFDWQSFEPNASTFNTLADPANALNVFTSPDPDQPPTGFEQAQALYSIADSLIDGYDNLTEEQQIRLDDNLNIQRIKELLNEDAYSALIEEGDTSTTFDERLVNAGLATHDNNTGVYTITDQQLVALLTPSVLENLEDIIAPTAPIAPQDETPFDWSNYAAAGSFELIVDTTDETNPWHQAGSVATSEELISRADNVFQLIGRIGNSPVDVVNNANLVSLGIAEVQNLNQAEVDTITSSLSELIEEKGGVELNLLINMEV